ncbi:MAG: M28 family peptidase [Kiritimatiellaeota bacterium]|nr:M28 family peptidase [Kiritimatiellota bacterium]
MQTQALLEAVSGDRIRQDLFHLSSDPLPFRKMNHTRPGQTTCSLYEADEFIEKELTSAGCRVSKTFHRVQAFRCDSSKPIHHWYAPAKPEDPWYEAANIEAVIPGADLPEEIVQLVAHKDSMSWIDSPGAHDNCAGTVVNLEIARLLAGATPRRTVRFLFCNEEHTPWTSRAAAEAAAVRGDRIIAVLNQDALDGKSDADMAAGRMTHVAAYSTDEGRPLAELAAACNARYGIGLDCRVAFKERVNDDDGMFIKAGFRTTIMNVGSLPYADSEYHLPGDRPERVNIENLVRSARLVLATVLEIDANGMG